MRGIFSTDKKSWHKHDSESIEINKLYYKLKRKKMERILIITLFTFLSINIYSQESLLKFNEYKPEYVPKHNVEATRQMLNTLYQRALAEAKEKKQRSIAKMNQTITFYNSVDKYPVSIIDGWHRVTSTNNYDFCDERLVYVENNKITKCYYSAGFE